MIWLSGSGREKVRGRKVPTRVCRWPLRRNRRATKGRTHGEASVISNRSSFVAPIGCLISLTDTYCDAYSGIELCWCNGRKAGRAEERGPDPFIIRKAR